MKTDSLFDCLFSVHAGAGVGTVSDHDFRAVGLCVLFRGDQADGVSTGRCIDASGEVREALVVFIKVQYQPDEEVYGRFFAGFLLYLYRCQPPHPWRALVIYPDRAVERPNELHYGSLRNLPKVRQVYIGRFRWTTGDHDGHAFDPVADRRCETGGFVGGGVAAAGAKGEKAMGFVLDSWTFQHD